MRDWHHAPVHRLTDAGAYIVTAGTYQKEHLFASAERLTILHDRLLDLCEEYCWALQAWSVFSNHYHFVSLSPDNPASLVQMLTRLHCETAVAVNELDGTPGRQVWFNYWDTRLSFQRSYLARLNYVHYNAQKHGVCDTAERYPWCSAGWLERTAAPGFVRTIRSFKSDRVNVVDDYAPAYPLGRSRR